jgi:hypothetical protein
MGLLPQVSPRVQFCTSVCNGGCTQLGRCGEAAGRGKHTTLPRLEAVYMFMFYVEWGHGAGCRGPRNAVGERPRMGTGMVSREQ